MKHPAAIRSRPSPGNDLPAPRTRILRQARADFFVQGYSRFTMDGLAAELGLSKKTLYVHFAGKDEIIGAVIDDLAAEIRAAADTLMASRELNLAEKLRAFIEGLMERLAALSPATLRDLQRFAPPRRSSCFRHSIVKVCPARYWKPWQRAGPSLQPTRPAAGIR